MESIYNLQKRAAALRKQTQTDSITPEDVGGLHYDTLEYIANMEQSADGLGIRNVYKTKAAMEADKSPVGTNGKALRYGQLVCVYDETNPTSAENGDIYAWQNPGWLLMGNMGSIYELKEKIEAEAAARQQADETLNRRLGELSDRHSEDIKTLQGGVDIETTARKNADSQLFQTLAKEVTDRESACVSLQKSISAEGIARDSLARELRASITNEGKAREADISAVRDNQVGLQNGMTVRIHEITDLVEIEDSTVSTETEGLPVRYDEYRKVFYVEDEGVNYRNFPEKDQYMDSSFRPLKDKIYLLGETMYVWSKEKGTLIESGGKGNGSGYYNVTEQIPLDSGYYTKTTAIVALAGVDIEDEQKRGMIITFETAPGKWADYRFTGTSLDTFLSPGAWEEHGSAGAVKQITLNGQKRTPDEQGNVNISIDVPEVDESLDADSTNPVQNAAVTAKVAELESGTLFGSEVVENDDNTVTVQLKSKSATITEFTIPSGGVGGGDDSSATKIVLGASMDATTIKEGGTAILTWTYDHQYSGGDDKGESTGAKATVDIIIRRGTTTTYRNTMQDVSKGTYTLDLTKFLLLGTSDIYVTAVTTDPNTGKQQKKQAYVSVKVVTLSLSSIYDLASGLSSGGYANTDTVEIPYAVSGTGTKTVTLYVDGIQRNAYTVTRSGTTNGTFILDMAGLSAGRHNVQLVAEMETDGLTLRSESIYIDTLKRGSSAPFIGMKIVHSDGRIVTGSGHTVPIIEVGQYEQCVFEFVAYDPAVTPATVEILKNGNPLRSVSVPRTTQTYSDRFTEKGRQQQVFRIGTTSYTLNINVAESGIDISEATYGLLFKLDTTGRNNEESHPNKWESNGIQTIFENVDWSSNGWVNGALKLTNGAKAIIGYKPFATDVKSTGLTLELTMRVTNVMSRNAAVVSCIDSGKGLLITTDEASFKTGEEVIYENEDGETVQREIKLATNYAAGAWMKVALMIGTSAEDRLMQLYVTGNCTGADIYDASFNFKQDNPQEITIDSSEADVEIKSIRVYSRALTDDEELENRMVDSTTTDEMMEIFSENDILGETGDVDMDKLRGQGKGVLRIVRQNKLDDVYAENNKKTDFLADIYYYSALGKEYDFILTGCYIRIQGTSSTKYPSKNLRIYCSKGSEQLSMSGDKVTAGNKYTMRPGAIAANLFCCKSDYSDSSMSLNTGGAKLFNDTMKELGLLTPPQRHQYEQGGSMNAVTVRSAIDGMPVDIFCAETVDGENTYYGQYNFNNEKSKSGAIFGMEGVENYTAECPITLEMLNNTSPICLFRTTSDAQLAADFDAGAEVNYGKDASGKAQTDGDVKWSGLAPAQQAALTRLYTWIRSCIPAGANANDLSTFKSEKFKSEIDQYFDKDFILTYYLFTDYFLSVDQRAKNMMLRTWDGKIWYTTYYDGDTQLGKRNDCFLVYTYTTDRDTYDAEASKYAFEGRDSWLWNLVLANLEDDLKRCAASFRAVMTNERVLSMLNDEQSGNWSDRAFNKSGYLKYIAPATREMYGKVWPFIYALQGSNKSHRTFFIQNRFALLDAKYGTSNFTRDNIDLYMARTAGDTADVLKITANEVYAFGYGTNNSQNIANTGIIGEGDTASLPITGAYTVNDPLRVYGASRMRVLDMTGAASHLKNALDLSKCSVLRELNLQAAQGQGSTGWWLSLGSCRQLRKLNVRNQSQAKTGGSTSTALDLTNQTKLEELDARGTNVQSVQFAKGAPITTAYLPGTLTTLQLEYLGKLPMSGLTLETYGNVKTFIFDNCPNLNWVALLARCANVTRLRVTGIDREDDGTWLNGFMSMGGVDTSGNFTDTCALVGTVRLTRYLAEEEYERMRSHFPELNIIQPEYTMIEFDDTVSDDSNVSNLDNGTGYKSGNRYEPSGHISAILSRRHRVLAKVTKKATARNVNIANIDTTMPNPDGEMTYCLLDDSDSNFYADGSPAKLDGSEGDLMMYEPFFWSKGVNDYLNGKHYSCYSSNDSDHMPSVPEARVLTLDDIQRVATDYLKGRKIMTGKETLQSSYSTDANYSVCRVDVSGYKRVRFPSVPGTNMVGSVFTDAEGNILQSVVVETLNSRFEAGMYLICDVPSDAAYLHFTILNTAEFDKVVLSNSDRIEDMEPDWVANDEHLCAVVGSSIVGSKLRSCITGGSTASNMSWADFHYYSVQRGMQQIDALMHFRIANLFYAKYGRRDSQEQCGAGQHTNNRTTGGTAKYGMIDTIGYDEAHHIKENITNNLVDNLVHQYAWYRSKDEYGADTVIQVNNTSCLGYEDIYGNKYDMMDGVDIPNTTGNQGKWRIWMPDGSIRWVKGKTATDQWTTAVSHGKDMDVIPVGSVNGSSSTYYCDRYYISTAVGRVVYRGCNYANAYGGVSHASAYYDASSAFTNVGSRLAFRGKLVRAQSVETYKAIVGVA